MKEKEPLTTVWITKYALSDGILKIQAEIHKNENLVVYLSPKTSLRQYAHGNDWHTSAFDAFQQAQHKLDLKIASLKKQIAKLEKLQIKITEPK